MRKLLLVIGLVSILMSTKPIDNELLKTQLIVTVLDDVGTIQEGATVKLYKTEEDYNKGENQVLETGITNAKGKTRFIGLEPIAYFMEVQSGKKDNSLGAEKTSVLVEGKINKVNVIVE